MTNPSISWSAADFFEKLAESNKLARQIGIKFCRVSGLQGFQDCLAVMRSAKAILAVSDSDSGAVVLSNTPHSVDMKLVLLAMRHPVDDMKARAKALVTLRELFRQLASRLILEKVALEEIGIYIDDNIQYTEANRYFFSGMACAYFQIRTVSYSSFEFDDTEWEQLT